MNVIDVMKVCLIEVFCTYFFQFGFRKWKGNVTERPIEDRSDIIKELYSDLSIVKPQQGYFSYILYSNYHTCVNNRK